MRKKIVAQRYAKSLIELAQELGKTDQLFADMIALQETARCVPYFVKALSDERISIKNRKATIKRVCEELKLWKCTSDALLLLMEKKRIDLIPEISRDVLSIIRLKKKIAMACVQVADRATADDVKEHVEEILTKLLGLTVECEVGIDPSLIGGFVVAVGDMRFDSSIKGKLTRMKEDFFSEAKGY
ncbi:MAG: ATP synthase F1 subunit delta [Pseudomonadota bacterium]